ncbi:MFS transporter [Alicyclobacillus fastidiosus]|uniref:MFS transporter n=1 Tax=Alicyclobacillus fastidiosus TaxID=392011 RepID=A0ABV5AC52_9BACL|nr:MFS transporter [Alicyclobacillus fastidiosus]WEH11510.1 MFS transporter [Alicyclobacillus fastidiosus]
MLSPWRVFWAAFTAGVAATLVQFAVPPVLILIQVKYQTSYASNGLLMSVFAFATILSAVPGGLIVQRYGVRKISLAGLGLMFVGILLSLATRYFLVFLIGRLVQGIGFGLTAVAAPSAIGQTMPSKHMDLAMGIWSTWVPLGSLIMFGVGPSIASHFHMSLYFSGLLLVIGVVAVFQWLFLPRNDVPPTQQLSRDKTVSRQFVKSELKNANVWLLAMIFASFTFAFFAFNTWITVYLTQSRGLSLTQASRIPILVSFFVVISNLCSGWILKKYRDKIFAYVLPPFLMALIWPTFSFHSIPVLYMSSVILGLVGGFIPTLVFAKAPALARKSETVGIAMCVIIFGENIGILLGPEVFGLLRDYIGNFVVGFWICLLIGLGAVMNISKIARMHRES